MHRGVQICLLHASLELVEHQTGDPVPALGPVEGDAGDPAGDLVGDRAAPSHTQAA